MNNRARDEEEEDDQGEVFLDESDIIHEVTVDEEDLPDVDDRTASDAEILGIAYLVQLKSFFPSINIYI